MDIAHWSVTQEEEWVKTSTDFPAVLIMGGHRYRLADRTLPTRFHASAFLERVRAIILGGEFLPIACFTWVAYQADNSDLGRFNYYDFAAVPSDVSSRLAGQGGALYVREDVSNVAASRTD